MPLYKNIPEPSGRMGLLWTLGMVKNGAILEFGSMGHMLYGEKWLSQTGIQNRCKLFTTHLDEKDIALGLTKRFERAIGEIAEDKNIKVIFVLPSSVPEMIGIDMEAICAEIQEEYKEIHIISLGCGNFKGTKNQGIEEGLYQLVKAIPKINTPKSDLLISKQKLQYNLIGSVCDMARFRSDAREIIRILDTAFPMEEICVMTADTSISDLERMALADINIVIRKEGIKAAKEMEKSFGIPYLYGSPYGYEGTRNWIHNLEQLIGVEADKDFLKKEIEEGIYTVNTCKLMVHFRKERAKIWLEGNEDITKGIADFACADLGFTLEKGGILMANAKNLNLKAAPFGIALERSLDSNVFNLYESPFMGFRGAMKLCALWTEYLMKSD